MYTNLMSTHGRMFCVEHFSARTSSAAAGTVSPGPPQQASGGWACIAQEAPAGSWARPGSSNVWHSEERGGKRIVQSHVQQAPPAAQPTLFRGPCGPPQDGKNPLGSGPHQLSDEAEGLVAQRPPDSQARTQSRWVPARSSLCILFTHLPREEALPGERCVIRNPSQKLGVLAPDKCFLPLRDVCR